MRYSRLSSREQFEQRKAQMAEHQGMIKDIVIQLTRDEQMVINEQVRNIVNENTNLTGRDGFYWRNQVLTNVQRQPGLGTRHIQKAPIHPSLQGRMQEIWDQQEALDVNKRKLMQGFAVLLRNVYDKADIRNALPEPVVKILDGGRLMTYPRTKDECYTLTSQLHRKQFKETEELIFYYLASRIITG